MENKRRKANDAAFKLKAINLRWDCESDNEETEVSALFSSDTEEEDFDGFSAQEEDEEGDQWLFLIGYCLFFFLPAVLQALFVSDGYLGQNNRCYRHCLGKKSICLCYAFN